MSRRFPIAARARSSRRLTDNSRRRRARLELLETRSMLDSNPIVTVDTNFGNFQIELFPTAAPQTVANFLSYVNDGAYNDVIFHRSVPGFVEQTGGYLSPTNTFSGSTSQFTPITTNAAIPLEYNLPNLLGTVAMARDSSTGSATSQWFVNLADNSQTNGPSNNGGYAVFGQVISGMSVLYTIAGFPVDNVDGGTFSQLPVATGSQLVRITSTTVDSIDGTVFTDVNGNGVLDSGEPGLAGRTVFLNRDGSGVPDANNPSTATNSNGNYSFSGMASGTYTVSEVTPASGSLTTPLETVTVIAGSTTSGVNFGERPAIVGTVFSDANKDGQLDGGELGLSGRTVLLNIDGSGVADGNNPSTTTNSNGVYYFSDLAPGSYTVDEVVPSGVTLTTSASATAVVRAGLTALGVNFGEVPPPFTPDQNYIEQLYHDFLGRVAEPAGMHYWNNMMTAGVTRAVIAQDIEGSQEFHSDTITGFYEYYLHRAPDAGALTAFNTFLSAGGTPQQIAVGLTSSPEYFQGRGGGTDQGFLNALYG
ncbi:MAG: peptidylprolyl isomerase, partial [Pirellulales bacterium]